MTVESRDETETITWEGGEGGGGRGPEEPSGFSAKDEGC